MERPYCAVGEDLGIGSVTLAASALEGAQVQTVELGPLMASDSAESLVMVQERGQGLVTVFVTEAAYLTRRHQGPKSMDAVP